MTFIYPARKSKVGCLLPKLHLIGSLYSIYIVIEKGIVHYVFNLKQVNSRLLFRALRRHQLLSSPPVISTVTAQRVFEHNV